MVRTFALIFGIVYLLAGVLAFFSWIITPIASMSNIVDPAQGKTMSFLVVSLLRLACIGVGVWGIVSSRSYKEATIFGCSVAILYMLVALINWIPSLNSAFGIAPFFAQGAWLHIVAAAIAAYFGFVASEEPKPAMAWRKS